MRENGKRLLSDERSAELLLIGITVIWGLTFALVKKSLDDIQPFTFMAWRFMLAAAIMLVLCARKLKGLDRRMLVAGLLLGALLYGSYAFQTFGLQYTSAGNAGFITGLFIVFTPLLSVLFLRHRPGAKSLLAVGIALCGLWVLSVQPNMGINKGDALVLACAFTYSVHILLLDRYVKVHDLALLTFIQMVVLAVANTGSALAFEEFVLPPNGFVWMTVIICGALASALAFYVQGHAQKVLTPVRTSMVLIMEPVFSVVFGIIILGESLTWRGAVGSGLIFAGMLLTELPDDLWRKGRRD
ncbi:MAG: DMT family transporter [Actinomycetota bacterium]